MMKIGKKIIEKKREWSDAIERFGWDWFLRSKLLRMVRPGRIFSEHLLLSAADPENPRFADDRSETLPVVDLTPELLERSVAAGWVYPQNRHTMRYFFECDRGIATLDGDGCVSGYSWLRRKGTVEGFPLGANQVLIHSVFVRPDSRRRGLGGAMGRECLRRLAPGEIPLVSVRCENRYAIRNWTRLGLVPYLKLERMYRRSDGKLLRCRVRELIHSPLFSGFVGR